MHSHQAITVSGGQCKDWMGSSGPADKMSFPGLGVNADKSTMCWIKGMNPETVHSSVGQFSPHGGPGQASCYCWSVEAENGLLSDPRDGPQVAEEQGSTLDTSVH